MSLSIEGGKKLRAPHILQVLQLVWLWIKSSVSFGFAQSGGISMTGSTSLWTASLLRQGLSALTRLTSFMTENQLIAPGLTNAGAIGSQSPNVSYDR